MNVLVVKRSLKLVALALFVTFSPAVHADDRDPTANNLHAVADVIRAEGEYARNLAEARLAVARAELVEAQAAMEVQRVREMTLLVNRLEMQLRRLANDEYVLRNKVRMISEKSIHAQSLMAGHVSSANLQALSFLAIQGTDPEASLKVMTATVPAFPADEIIGSRADQPFEGQNVGQLIDFLRHNNLSVKPWGIAHQALAQAVVEINHAAEDRLEKIQTRLDELKNSVKPFDLPDHPVP